MHRRTFVAVALATAFALPAFAQKDAGGAIVIGQSVPLSGSNKDLGEDIREGALAYLKKVNNKTIIFLGVYLAKPVSS